MDHSSWAAGGDFVTASTWPSCGTLCKTSAAEIVTVSIRPPYPTVLKTHHCCNRIQANAAFIASYLCPFGKCLIWSLGFVQHESSRCANLLHREPYSIGHATIACRVLCSVPAASFLSGECFVGRWEGNWIVSFRSTVPTSMPHIELELTARKYRLLNPLEQ